MLEHSSRLFACAAVTLLVVDAAIAIPVGVVVSGMGGRKALLRMVRFVFHPSSTSLTRQSLFFESRHPQMMVYPLWMTLHPCLWKKTFQPVSQRTATERRLLTRPGSRWARRASSRSFVRRRFTACVDIILAPLGWRMVICILLFVVLPAGALGVSSVTEAAVSMNTVEDKSVGLAQPEWYLIEFANIVLLTTSVLINSAGAPCQTGGVGRPAVGQPALKVLPPIVLVRVAPA